MRSVAVAIIWVRHSINSSVSSYIIGAVVIKAHFNDLIPLKDFKKHHADLIGTRIEESMLDEKRILEMYQKFNLAKE